MEATTAMTRTMKRISGAALVAAAAAVTVFDPVVVREAEREREREWRTLGRGYGSANDSGDRSCPSDRHLEPLAADWMLAREAGESGNEG